MKKSKHKNENGITLIALVVTIIILVIIAGITLKNITGGDGITETALSAADKYKMESYASQIEEVAQGEIISKSSKGQEPTIKGIAERLAMETEWITAAVSFEDETVTCPHVLVTVKEGYVYQVFYDNIYGKLSLEYIGKVKPGEPADSDAIPKVAVEYQKIPGNLIINTSITKRKHSKHRNRI